MSTVTYFKVVDEICPNCGKDTSELNTATGWCRQCSTKPHKEKLPKSSVDEDLRLRIARLRQNNPLLSYRRARELAYEERAILCVICHNPIRGGTHRAKFCGGQHGEICAKAQKHFHYLVYTRRIPKAEALQMTIEKYEIT